MPTKFGYDKRKAHLASLIVSGQLAREAALQELAMPLYDPDELELDITYFCKKLNISREEYEKVMAAPPKTHRDYPNREAAYARMRQASQVAARARHALLRRAPKTLQHVAGTAR